MDWLFPENVWTVLTVPLAAGLFLYAAFRRHRLADVFGEPELVAKLTASINPRMDSLEVAMKAHFADG